jgi:hypothetical protein
VQKVTSQQPEKTQKPPTQKEQEAETMDIVVKGSDTFVVTQKMMRVDEETTRKPVGDIDQLELAVA